MTAFAASALLFGAMADVLRRRRAGALGQPSGQLGVHARVLRAGVGWMRPFARAALQVGAVRSWANEAALSLGQRGIPASAENACSLAVIAVVAVLCAGWAVSGDFAAGCAVAACAVLALRGAVKRGSDERLEALRDAVPEALRSLGVCFQAGFFASSDISPDRKRTARALARIVRTGGACPRDGRHRVRGLGMPAEELFVRACVRRGSAGRPAYRGRQHAAGSGCSGRLYCRGGRASSLNAGSDCPGKAVRTGGKRHAIRAHSGIHADNGRFPCPIFPELCRIRAALFGRCHASVGNTPGSSHAHGRGVLRCLQR